MKRQTPISCMIAIACMLAGGCASIAPEPTRVRETTIAAPAAPLRADGRPRMTIDALLERRVVRVEGLYWYDNEHMVVELGGLDAASTGAHLIGLDGSIRPFEGINGVRSPDHAAYLRRTEQGWELIEAATEAAVPIPPADDDRMFSGLYDAVWSRDGRYVAFAEVHDDSGPIEHTAAEVNGVSLIDVGVAESHPPMVSRVTIIERSHPETPRRILLEGLVYYVRWAPNGALYLTRVAFADENPYTEIQFLAPDENTTLHTVYRTAGRFQSLAPNLSPDGTSIAASLDADNRNWNDFESLVLVDPRTGAETRLTRDLPIFGRSIVWSREGDEIYAPVRAGGLNQIWAVPIDGEPRQLTSGPQRHYEPVLSPQGDRLAYLTEDGYGRRDVRVLDLESGVETIVFVVDEPARDFALSEWQHIRWESTDGVRPYGYIFLPPDFDPHRRYPMLVDVHGGGPGSWLYLAAPLSINVAPGPLEWHAWAALGYVVFVPDYRSTGDYGPSVITRRLANGEFSPLDDVDDIVSGVRAVIAKGYIDSGRIAILGHSAGGPRAYNAIAQNPDLFAAAVVNEGIAPDPTSTSIQLLSGRFAGGSGMGILEDEFHAEMSDAPARYSQNTMFAAAHVHTPLLIMMGTEENGGVGHWPWEVVFSILRSSDLPTRMLIFTEEGHTYSRTESARLAFETVRAWLEQYMPAEDLTPVRR